MKVAELKLSNGNFAIVDKDDFSKFVSHKWYQHNSGYAVRKPRGSSAIYMHRQVIECPKGFEIDHINRNPLDNRKENLRAVSHSENSQNRPKQRNNTSGYKGVFFDKRRNKWWSMKVKNKKRIYLGTFNSAQEASKAYESS